MGQRWALRKRRLLRRRARITSWVALAVFCHLVPALSCLFVHPCHAASWRVPIVLRAVAAPMALLSWAFAGLGLAHLVVDLSGNTRFPLLVARRVRALVEATVRHPMVVESAAGVAVLFGLWGLSGWGEPSALVGSLAATMLAVASVRRSLAPLLLVRGRIVSARSTAREVSLPIRARAYAASAPARAFGAVSLFLFLWATAGLATGRTPEMRNDIALALFSVYFAVVVLGTLAGRSRVLIGVDGVLLMQGLNRSSFFAFSEVASVERSGVSIVLRGPSVGSLALHLDPFAQAGTEAVVANLAWLALGAQGTEKHRSVLERLRTTVHYERADGADATVTMAPRGYREPALRREDLWAVAEGSFADGAARLSAATVLSQRLHEGERARLASVASKCVEPGLSQAMLRVAAVGREGLG